MADDFINYVQNRWTAFAQFGIWILAVAGTFLVEPPLLTYSDASSVLPFTRFVIAGLTAILIIPAKKKSGKTDYRLWHTLSILFFIGFLLCAVRYYTMSLNWGVRFYNQTLVRGSNMLQEAAKYKDTVAVLLGKPSVDDGDMVKARHGETQTIWPIGELKRRYYIMVVTYIGTVVLLAVFLVAVIQAIYCYEKKGE